MSSPFDLLLNMELQNPKTQDVKIKRLSRICGEPVVFTIKELSYNKVKELQELNGNSGDINISIILEGTISPSLRDSKLMEKFGAPTPAEMLPKMLSAGEIDDLSRAIEKLSGYRMNTLEIVEDVKKN